jgi:Cu2+-exporting ATPase
VDWSCTTGPICKRAFVRVEGEHVREAALMLEGIVCAACVWLNERHVNALPGVLEFRVNYSTHRAQVRWDERQIKLSAILAAIAAIGYIAHPFDPNRQEAIAETRTHRRLAPAGGRRSGLDAGDDAGGGPVRRRLSRHGSTGFGNFLRWICLILTVPVVAYSAQPFYIGRVARSAPPATGDGCAGRIGHVAAFAASVWYTCNGGGEVYYDSVTMFVFFLLTGRFLEMTARHRAGQISEALVRMLPATATRLEQSARRGRVPIAELAPGDRVLVRPGETIPADGRVRGRGEQRG